MIPSTLLTISSTSASARYQWFVLTWNDLLNITCVNLKRKYWILQKLITLKTQPTEIAVSVSICFARALFEQSQPLPWGSGFRCDDGEIIILQNRFVLKARRAYYCSITIQVSECNHRCLYSLLLQKLFNMNLFGLLLVQQAFFADINSFTLRLTVFEFPLFLVECLDLRE